MTLRLSTLIGGYTAVLLLMALGSCALMLWHNEQSSRWGLRLQLAQASYHEHAALQSNIYQLFKQHGDAMLIGDRDTGAMEAKLESSIAANISTIRDLIAQEIELEGGEEIEELTLLAMIERKVEQLTEAMALFTADGRPLDMDERRAHLVQLLDQEIDVDLSGLITSALEGEREEVTETRAAAQVFRGRITIAAYLMGAIALIFTAGAGWYYHRSVAQPLRRLMEGVTTYGAGRFDNPVVAGGAEEFGKMGSVLSIMARNLSERELTRKQQTERLEQAVRARTSELERLLARFEMSESNRRQLMADISHELRTPLTIIQGEAEVCLRGGTKDADIYKDSLTRVLDAARHTSRIVDDMLLVARQEAGQLRLDLKEVDLRQILTDAAALMPGSITVRSDLPNLSLQADRVRLSQCLVALFHNALRYGGPNVTSWFEQAAGDALIIVEDDGPGLSDAEKAQAFERFFRGTNAMRAETEGNGLGLPIVRAIVEAHGGTATISDRVGGGLRVELRLPMGPRIGLVWDSGTQPIDLTASSAPSA